MTNIVEIKNNENPMQEDDNHLPEMEPVNILVVDDLPDKLLVYESILEELGQNLITARSGEEALKLVLKHEFAVILLDVNMPGMDGFETATLIRQRKRSSHTPIIFLTAFIDDMRMAQGYASGAVDYLPTPVVPEVLQAKVRVFIELSQMRRQAALQAEERALRTAAEESARRLEFLVRGSEILARSQNEKEILQALVRFPIPYLADISLLWVAGDETEESRIDWAWQDKNEDSVMSGTLPASVPGLPWLDKVIARVLKTGQFMVMEELPPPLPIEAKKIVHPDLLLLRSAMILPVNVRGQIRGVLVLGRKRSTAINTPSDLSLANDLACRAGIALENAILIDRIQEADRRKDEFLGMLAHELRNPLGPIHNAIHLMQLIGPKEPRMEQARDIIRRQVAHMVRLIDDLLDATRLARGKILLRKEQCDLTKITRQTAEDYRSIFDASGLQLEIKVPDSPVWIMGDPTRLVQSIGNLLHNAHKFTDPGGTITVSLEIEGESTGVITVRDTGIGIDTKMLGYVFDVFRQAEQGLDRSRGGLGLGLALVKGLTELHDGEVSVQSDGLKKGAAFSIRLPVDTTPRPLKDDALNQPALRGGKYRILVIEDNHDTADSTQMLLNMEGYDVKTAYSGGAGIEVAKSFRPHVILCDIGLPGMDGYQVARALRQDATLSSAYIIALTGYGRDADQRLAQEAGFDLHLTKPIDYNNLRRLLAVFNIKAKPKGKARKQKQ